MNKKLIALVAALFVATSAQGYCRNHVDTINQTWPTKFESTQNIKALAAALAKPDFNAAYTAQRNFERNVQTGFLIAGGTVAATFFGCMFMEWLQEFKVRKAEKAKLIARLKCETREVRATCYAN